MTRILAGEVGEFEIGTQKSLEFGSDYVLVLRSLSGFWAIEDRCSHNDIELLGGPVAEREGLPPSIKCLKHGASFDLGTGKALSLPAFKAVKSYRVVLYGHEIWVESQS
jgi:3-phenylpropionate/trans-cinnamate dioxygenase ferredoxin component